MVVESPVVRQRSAKLRDEDGGEGGSPLHNINHNHSMYARFHFDYVSSPVILNKNGIPL